MKITNYQRMLEHQIPALLLCEKVLINIALRALRDAAKNVQHIICESYNLENCNQFSMHDRASGVYAISYQTYRRILI
jgi:hypothetical protein